MSKSGFKLNRNGVRDLLRSQEMQEGLLQYAQAVMKSAGDGYEISSYVGKTRANVSVSTASKKAYQDCLDNNTLLRALGSAGDKS